MARLLEMSRKRHGTLGAHFLSFLRSDARTVEMALNGLIEEWRNWYKSDIAEKSPSFSYLLTAPADGSCCKRWCMFLRWMGRRDALDPGLWTSGGPLHSALGRGPRLDAARLVIPLDTHTGRISLALGLTTRRSLGWSAALEVTRALAKFDASDPVKYDFALARLGILDLCQNKFDVELCRTCQLRRYCAFERN